eukprot:CAMPEP_0167796834 /NCGR_PEP_ID=MMETSP0111_2-20121227/15288_1 /TAXON_ID=91324 /ORGANISM="Lotharella globosa, Strain CCCM811" /LENGTH=327 /DNA_ID=CAMNT_0007690811 /DNA_START=117 /DNA_END=1097 /DNA_ORIENTATION=-
MFKFAEELQEDEILKEKEDKAAALRPSPRRMARQVRRLFAVLDALGDDPRPLQILGAMRALSMRYEVETFRSAISYARNHNKTRSLIESLEFCDMLRMITEVSFEELTIDQLLDHNATFNVREARKKLGLEQEEEDKEVQIPAIELIQGAEKLGLKPGLVSYESLIGACERTHRWYEVLDLFESMPSQSLRRTVGMYNAAVRSTGALGQWYRGLKILAKMDREGYGFEEEDTREAMGVVGEAMLNDTGWDGAMIRVDNTKFEFDRSIPPPESLISVVDEDYVSRDNYERGETTWKNTQDIGQGVKNPTLEEAWARFAECGDDDEDVW